MCSRTKLAAVLVSLLAVTPLQAGDYADSLILGFSENGDYVAFEEYGVQDGSGFPYANIYVIDTRADSWVEGTPIRVLKQDEQIPLSDARNEALSQAYPIVTGLGIGSAGTQVASNPVTETSADPLSVRFLPSRFLPPGSGEMHLALKQFPMTPNSDCPDMGQPFRGYSLTLTLKSGARRELHRDRNIPSSRGCPLSYGISEVVTYRPPQGELALVVLLNVFKVGFEGPDRRFIALATRLQQ